MGPEFDVIVVGAGPAGSAASLTLAKKGVNVLLVEKGRVPGDKNMSGGVLYGDFPGDWGLNGLVPNYEASAPLQRRIVSHEVVFLGAPNLERGTSRYYRLSKSSLPARVGLFPLAFETGHDYSVLRHPFDGWFAEQVASAGATISTGTTVEGLLKESGSVVGVRTNKEELRAKLVIDSSGVTSKLVAEAGLRDAWSPRQLYHGIKRVYELDSKEIERRFGVRPGEGRAVFYIGNFMRGIAGSAFIVTNKDTLSVGVIVSFDSLIRNTTERFDEVGKVLEVLDGFEGHPMVADMLEGAKPLEFSAHNVPKGYNAIPKIPYADGYLVAGDALGSFVKFGAMMDGMRRAITSGSMAASTYLEARTSGSFKGRNLSRYKDLLTPIYEDVNRSGRDSFFSESSITYHTLPMLIFATRLLSSTYKFEPKEGIESTMDSSVRVSPSNLTAFDEDVDYSHIKVDSQLASKSVTKPWVPTCPADCFAISTTKGTFVSFKDLYEHNLNQNGANRGKAMSDSIAEIASAQLHFDRARCVSCGNCGAIGPKEMVEFGHEHEGNGVLYKLG